MWTTFIRALMGRRIGDHIGDGDDSRSELVEQCLQTWHNIHNPAGGSNVSVADIKRCRVSVPHLLSVHRKVSRAKDDETDDMRL